MENKEVKVILKPGHEVILKSDATRHRCPC